MAEGPHLVKRRNGLNDLASPGFRPPRHRMDSHGQGPVSKWIHLARTKQAWFPAINIYTGNESGRFCFFARAPNESPKASKCKPSHIQCGFLLALLKPIVPYPSQHMFVTLCSLRCSWTHTHTHTPAHVRCADTPQTQNELVCPR